MKPSISSTWTLSTKKNVKSAQWGDRHPQDDLQGEEVPDPGGDTEKFCTGSDHSSDFGEENVKIVNRSSRTKCWLQPSVTSNKRWKNGILIWLNTDRLRLSRKCLIILSFGICSFLSGVFWQDREKGRKGQTSSDQQRYQTILHTKWKVTEIQKYYFH